MLCCTWLLCCRSWCESWLVCHSVGVYLLPPVQTSQVSPLHLSKPYQAMHCGKQTVAGGKYIALQLIKCRPVEMRPNIARNIMSQLACAADQSLWNIWPSVALDKTPFPPLDNLSTTTFAQQDQRRVQNRCTSHPLRILEISTKQPTLTTFYNRASVHQNA